MGLVENRAQRVLRTLTGTRSSGAKGPWWPADERQGQKKNKETWWLLPATGFTPGSSSPPSRSEAPAGALSPCRSTEFGASATGSTGQSDAPPPTVVGTAFETPRSPVPAWPLGGAPQIDAASGFAPSSLRLPKQRYRRAQTEQILAGK